MLTQPFPDRWRVVPASVTGPDHLARGVENQDAFGYRRLGDGQVLAVADGAGSRYRASLGSLLAVQAACDAAGEVLGVPPAGGAAWRQAAQRWVRTILRLFDRRLAAVVGSGAAALRSDCATTLLAVVAHPPRYLYANLGDGFLVVQHGDGGPHLVAPPDRGGGDVETVFLTSAGRTDALRVGLLEDDAVRGLALCTDGLIEAVLAADRWPDGSPRLYAPADFAGYFAAVRGTRPEVADLSRRLQSAELAATSRDDKTMVLAVRP